MWNYIFFILSLSLSLSLSLFHIDFVSLVAEAAVL
jgi:hypothetical protein